MIPVPWIIPVVYLVGYAVAGMAIGALTGTLLSLALKLKIRGVIKDGLLGSCGFLLGIIGTIFMPWPQNTVISHIGNVVETSTMNRYQHPERVAIVVAILLPLLRVLFRFKRERAGVVPHSRVNNDSRNRPT